MDAKDIKSKATEMKVELQKVAEKEIVKAKKELENVGKKIEEYTKKNPEKAAMISAGIGAALGAAVAVLLGKAGKGKKK
ncbi:MAG: hypothetical protein WC848_03390 [Parcubacteria group bacterium]|jgi:ElaB/YqjD/DUF883 family membrane-anchored ribosome-binding protein